MRTRVPLSRKTLPTVVIKRVSRVRVSSDSLPSQVRNYDQRFLLDRLPHVAEVATVSVRIIGAPNLAICCRCPFQISTRPFF